MKNVAGEILAGGFSRRKPMRVLPPASAMFFF
jgi:hypothetical protein